MGAAYGSAGERCMAISVVVAVGTSADPLIDLLKNRIASLQIGASDDPTSDMGPLVTRAHCDRVRSYVELGVKEGAHLIVDGRSLTVPKGMHGFFLGPCLFDHVTTNMRVYQEEIFGPVLCIVRVHSLDEAIACVNAHPYGNGTSIFTTSGHAARAYTTRVQVGMHGVNVPIPVPMAFHSFGGAKQSIFGSHGMHGDEGVHFYTQLSTITARWPKTSSGPDFHMPILG
jgi:malonate-semialdehyde dehydrogenase (acetylating)/methylmalonate-semialdehyde dehydrogenase